MLIFSVCLVIFTVPINTREPNQQFKIIKEHTCQNWSGYVAERRQTRQNYTSVSGAWIVPSVSVPSGISDESRNKVRIFYSAIWIGIGGYCYKSNCTNSEKKIVQMGTDQSAIYGAVKGYDYYAWYELFPYPTKIILNFKVTPGDLVAASIRLISRSKGKQIWQLKLTNISRHQTWARNFKFCLPHYSAEWILEAPGFPTLPLANFGVATFKSIMANGMKPSILTKVIAKNRHGQTSNPSLPNPETGGFNICWGKGAALTPCEMPR
jgi:hypothetical protein